MQQCFRLTRRLPFLVAISALTVTAAWTRQASSAERWLHVRVDHAEAKSEMVRVNLPLSLAEKVLPTINNERLHNGKLRIDEARLNGVDLRALLEAVRSSQDGEYVTIQGENGDIRVFKKAGYFEAHIWNKKDTNRSQVEIRVPLAVIDALLSASGNELDVVAALRVLAARGDSELVVVKDKQSTIRVWLDSKNTD